VRGSKSTLQWQTPRGKRKFSPSFKSIPDLECTRVPLCIPLRRLVLSRPPPLPLRDNFCVQAVYKQDQLLSTFSQVRTILVHTRPFFHCRFTEVPLPLRFFTHHLSLITSPHFTLIPNHSNFSIPTPSQSLHPLFPNHQSHLPKIHKFTSQNPSRHNLTTLPALPPCRVSSTTCYSTLFSRPTYIPLLMRQIPQEHNPILFPLIDENSLLTTQNSTAQHNTAHLPKFKPSSATNQPLFNPSSLEVSSFPASKSRTSHRHLSTSLVQSM
jgi:hypothetical protein